MFEHYLHRAEMERMEAHRCMNYAIMDRRDGRVFSATLHMNYARKSLRRAIEFIQSAKRVKRLSRVAV